MSYTLFLETHLLHKYIQIHLTIYMTVRKNHHNSQMAEKKTDYLFLYWVVVYIILQFIYFFIC